MRTGVSVRGVRLVAPWILLAIALSAELAEAGTGTSSSARWNDAWPRVRAAEYGISAGLLLTAGAATLLVPHPPGGWKGRTVLDDSVADLFRNEDRQTRETLSDISDVLANAATVFPILDAGLGAFILADDTDVLFQMLAIDLEGALLAGTLLVLTKRLVSRVRPDIEPCAEPDDYLCRSDASRRSFVSGHTVASFTAAALTCAHHRSLALYGGPLDDLTCASMVGLALSASLLRIASDQHYATDVLGGMVIGLFSGLVVPYLFHYQVADQPSFGPRGHLSLILGGAAIAASAPARIAGSGELGVALEIGPEWLYVEIGADGRLMRRDVELEAQQVLPRIGLGHEGIFLGALGDFRRQRISKDAPVDTFALGPYFSVESGPASVGLGWLPLLDGQPTSGLARVELRPLDWLVLRAEANQSSLTMDGAPRTVSTFLLGAGGRWAW